MMYQTRSTPDKKTIDAMIEGKGYLTKEEVLAVIKEYLDSLDGDSGKY